MTIEKLFDEFMENSGFKTANSVPGMPGKIVFNEKECFMAEVKSRSYRIRDCEVEKAKLLKKLWNIETRFYRYADGKFILEKRI